MFSIQIKFIGSANYTWQARDEAQTFATAKEAVAYANTHPTPYDAWLRVVGHDGVYATQARTTAPVCLLTRRPMKG